MLKRILLVAMKLKLGGAGIESGRRKETNPISDSNCMIPWRGKL
jgi:hypothetical protein